MARPISKSHHLIFDRRAITWPSPCDLTAIDGRQMEIVTNESVGCSRRCRNPARNLRIGNRPAHRTKSFRNIVPMVRRQAVPINRCPIKPRRCSRLQASQWQCKPPKRFRQTNRRRFTHPARSGRHVPNENPPLQKRPSRQHNCAAAEDLAVAAMNPSYSTRGIKNQILNRRLVTLQIHLLREQILNRLPIQTAISLRPGSTNGGAFAPVKHLEMNTSPVRCLAHQTV